MEVLASVHTRKVGRRTQEGRSGVPKPGFVCLTLQQVSQVVMALFLWAYLPALAWGRGLDVWGLGAGMGGMGLVLYLLE